VRSRLEKNAHGFTMVEIMVVMAILAILSSLAIATFTRAGLFARDDLQKGARELYGLLRAARIYAATYRVNTAVVYNLDNFVHPDANPGNSPGLSAPVMDSVTGGLVRVIQAAAIMYQVPEAAGFNVTQERPFVPVPNEKGSFLPFPGGIVLLLGDAVTNQAYYNSIRPRFAPVYDPSDSAYLENLNEGLGMNTRVLLCLDGTGPYAPPGSDDWLYPVTAEFPAHVFQPSGRLETTGGKERYVIYVAHSPDAMADVRLSDPGSGPSLDAGVVHIPIEIFKSTGRAEIAS